MIQIQLRRDTAANWSAANPVLAAGEMGWDTTNGGYKVGNGATAWNSLAYGVTGSTWRDGAGVPSNSLGINGDYYLNATNSDVYLKSSGTYSVVANIKGATGATGAQGPQGAQGAAGDTFHPFLLMGT